MIRELECLTKGKSQVGGPNGSWPTWRSWRSTCLAFVRTTASEIANEKRQEDSEQQKINRDLNSDNCLGPAWVADGPKDQESLEECFAS